MNDEQKYKEGFNASFLLAEHEPVLLKKIAKTVAPTSAFLEGFVDGSLQFELLKDEKELQNLQDIRNKISTLDLNRDI